MEKYFKTTLEALKTKEYKDVYIFLGNQSGDLDSAVSSLTYAMFSFWKYNHTKSKEENNVKDDIFVSVYNIDRSEYKNKTEVVFCFKEHGINENNLVFRDEIDLEALAKETTLKVTLVDHYQLAPNDQFLKDYVKEIVDHRPTYSTDFDKQIVEWKVSTVASCCTNILGAIRELSWPLKPYYALKYPAFFEEYEICAELLHCTILLDTANLSQELKRTTDADLEALEFLEGIIKPKDFMAERKVKFEKLMEARADVSSMEPDVLITKDLKIVGDILVPSFPILVQNFLKHPNAIDAVRKTMVSKGCTIAVLLGTSLIGTVKKDVLIYTSDLKPRAKKLTEFLLGYTTKNFGLEFDPAHSIVEHSFYYHQRNLQVSRKDYTYCINHFLECTSTAGIQNEC